MRELLPNFGRRCRELRCNQGMLQRHVAGMAGIDVWSLSHYERGKREPSVITVCKLARALRTTPNYLLGFIK